MAGEIQLYFSQDQGQTWSEPVETPARGIVADKLLELDSGRWILFCHDKEINFGYLEFNVYGIQMTMGELGRSQWWSDGSLG